MRSLLGGSRSHLAHVARSGGVVGAPLALALLLGVLGVLPPTRVIAAVGDAADGGVVGSVYLTKAGGGSVLPPSLEDAEAFCALTLACRDVAMYPPAPDFAGCVRALMTQLASPAAVNASLAIRECGLSATSCTRLRQCALKGADARLCEGAALDSKEPLGKCDLDARAITCWRGKVLGVRNCGLADELCVVRDGKAECALAGPCPAAAKADWACAGTRMVKCQDKKFLSVDCKVLNLTCVASTDAAGKSQVGCAPASSPACKGDKVTCSGSAAVGCVFGKEVRVACADQGMSCADPAKPSERTVGACEMPAPDKPCDAKKAEAKCEGSAIKYCAFGSPRAYQCKSIGYSKCVADKGTGPRCVQ